MRRLRAGTTVRGPALRFFRDTPLPCNGIHGATGEIRKMKHGAPERNLSYKLKIEKESIGKDLVLEIQSLANLNETIDELFEVLANEGNPNLLESLCPYFGVIWPSARGLAEHLAQSGTQELAGKSILEVGCGLALPSLVAAKLGAVVTATDFHPDIPLFLGRNIELNGIEQLDFVSSDWQSEDSRLGLYDWVIGSDILYEKQHAGPVARTLARHVAPGGRVLLADPGRPYLQAFADEMKAQGFVCEVLTRTVRDTPLFKDVFILEMIKGL
jgi:predicted nicotinamide N-methyase